LNSSDCINMVLFCKVLSAVLCCFMSPSFRYSDCTVENSKGTFSMNVFVALKTVVLLGEPLFAMGVFPFRGA
jgi:hypothetical protein